MIAIYEPFISIWVVRAIIDKLSKFSIIKLFIFTTSLLFSCIIIILSHIPPFFILFYPIKFVSSSHFTAVSQTVSFEFISFFIFITKELM
jgi:hypothetical protein